MANMAAPPRPEPKQETVAVRAFKLDLVFFHLLLQRSREEGEQDQAARRQEGGMKRILGVQKRNSGVVQAPQIRHM